MNLRNNDLHIRPLKEEDAYTSVKWRNNPAIWRMTINSPNKLISIEDELNWINKILKEKDSFRFAIIHKEQYVGNVQLTNIENYECYFGIFLGNIHSWVQGVGKMATILILDFAFLTLFLSKVKLRVRSDNVYAYKLYKSVGFNEVDRNQELIYMEIINKIDK